MGRASRRVRGTAFEGFALKPDRDIELHSERRGDLRKLRYTLEPDVLAAGKKRPELLDLIYHREVMMWTTRLEKEGYTIVTKPSSPHLTPALAWDVPKGSKWAIVEARFFHHGAIGVIRNDDMQEFQEYRQEIGAEKPQEGAGVAAWLESQREETAAALVAGAVPTKTEDDDFD